MSIKYQSMLEQIKRWHNCPFPIRFGFLPQVGLQVVRLHVSEETLLRSVAVVNLLYLTEAVRLRVGWIRSFWIYCTVILSYDITFGRIYSSLVVWLVSTVWKTTLTFIAYTLDLLSLLDRFRLKRSRFLDTLHRFIINSHSGIVVRFSFLVVKQSQLSGEGVFDCVLRRLLFGIFKVVSVGVISLLYPLFNNLGVAIFDFLLLLDRPFLLLSELMRNGIIWYPV